MAISLKSILKHVLKFLPDEVYLRLLYFKSHKKWLNLRNPKTINEKIQWLKVNDRTSLHTKCADKYLVREYVKEKIGSKYLVKLFQNTNNIFDIKKNSLPDKPFIIKCNHTSGFVYILKSKDDFDTLYFRKKFSKLIKENYYYPGREWQYKHIHPQILVEKLLLDESGEIPKDYKFHCFHGNVEFIQVDSSRFNKHTRNLYDTDWNILPFNWSPRVKKEPKYKNGPLDRQPITLNEMLILAEKLSKPFKYARIDLYSISNKIFFGEITFHQESGTAPFFPEKYDRIYGERLKLF